MSRTDLPLAVSAMEELAKSFSLLARLSPDAVVASPALRARQTADAIVENLAMRPYEVWNDLVEIDFGVFEGLTFQQIQGGPYAAAFRDWLDPYAQSPGAPGGETWAEVRRRASEVFGRLAERRENILVVGHGYFIRAILVTALAGLDPRHLRFLEFGNASVTTITNHRGYWRMEFHNSRSPLLED